MEVTGADADFTPMPEVYAAYRDWAYEEGLGRGEWRNQSDLKDDLRAALPGVRYTQRRVAGKRVWGLSGVSGVRPCDWERPGD